MKSLFKNLVMLIVLVAGSYLLITLGVGIWDSTRGVSWLNQVPIWCKALVVFAGIVWLVVCIIFGKPIAVYTSQAARTASLRLGSMTTRRKIIVSAGFATTLLAVGLFFWSPQARVDERLSMQDLVSLRLAARAHTLWPIIVLQADGDGHDMGNVIAGAKRSWVSGSGYYWYHFERTSYGGWRLSCWDPVTFMYPPSHVMLSVVLQIVEFIGIAALALVWCLRKESRWRIRTAIYAWAGFILFSLLWSFLIPAHYVSDSFGNRSTGASFSYFGMIAVAAFVFGWSWPAAISYLERKRRADDHVV